MESYGEPGMSVKREPIEAPLILKPGVYLLTETIDITKWAGRRLCALHFARDGVANAHGRAVSPS